MFVKVCLASEVSTLPLVQHKVYIPIQGRNRSLAAYVNVCLAFKERNISLVAHINICIALNARSAIGRACRYLCSLEKETYHWSWILILCSLEWTKRHWSHTCWYLCSLKEETYHWLRMLGCVFWSTNLPYMVWLSCEVQILPLEPECWCVFSCLWYMHPAY